MFQTVQSRISAVLVLISFLTLMPVYAANETHPIKVVIRGQDVSFHQDTGFPYLEKDGRTQVPLRATMEAFGAVVRWDGQTAYVQKGDTVVSVPMNQNYILVNGIRVPNDSSAYTVHGRTYCPIRKILEALGATVHWDAAHHAVIVNPSPYDSKGSTDYTERFQSVLMKSKETAIKILGEPNETENLYAENDTSESYAALFKYPGFVAYCDFDLEISSILLSERGASAFGVEFGMTGQEIMGVLGKAEIEYNESEGGYFLFYEIDGIEIYAEYADIHATEMFDILIKLP